MKKLLRNLSVSALLLATQGSINADPNSSQIKNEVKSILNSPQFHQNNTRHSILERPIATFEGWFRKFLERLNKFFQVFRRGWNKFWKWIAHFMGHSHQMSMPPSTSRFFVYALVTLLILGGLCALTWLIIAAQKRRQKRKPRVILELTEEDIADPDPQNWLQQAAAFTDIQDYKSAYRALFIALLFLMHQDRLLKVERYRSNGEYAKDIENTKPGEISSLFNSIVEDFDLHWYGSRDISYADVDVLRQRVVAISQLVSLSTDIKQALSA